MAFIEASLPPIKVWVRDGFFYDDPDGPEYVGKYTKAILISIRCNEGSAALFQVLTEQGMMRDKLPISAICWKIPEDESVWAKYPFHSLQLWDCFSKVFTVTTLNYIYNANVDIKMKNGDVLEGNYLLTIQWGANETFGQDLTLAEDSQEHKSHHMFMLDNGLFALQPNNRVMKWYEPSFVTSEYKGKPWKINTQEYSCEQYDKWMTEDSDNYLYTTKEHLSTLSEEVINEYQDAYEELAKSEIKDGIQHIAKEVAAKYVSKVDEVFIKEAKKPMKKTKKKLAAPQPKKGAKKKTTYLYGGPAK
jgi:hypothetical protein